MKLMRLTQYLLGISIACLSYSCDDAEYSSIENGVYIEEAAPSDKFNQQIETQLIDDKDVNIELNVRMAAPLDHDVKVRLLLDSNLIAQYNEKYSTGYTLLPSKYLTFKEDVIIPAGECKAAPVSVIIKPFITSNGETYAVPIRIEVEDLSVKTVGSADKLLYLLSTPNKQHSVVLSGRQTSIRLKGNIPAPQWTFEYWIKVNNKTRTPTGEWEGERHDALRKRIFAGNSSPIYLDGNEQVFLRYWPNGVKKIAPTLQCQLKGSFFDSSEFWWPDTWYHIAYTYDGSTLTLYKDGVQDNTLKVNKNFNFDQLIFCSSFGNEQEVEFAQIRLWNKCLPANVIQDGMSRQIPVDSEGLVGYWKCDEKEGKTLKDSSVNGNDIDFSQSGVSTIKWSEEVYNFSHPNKTE